MPRIRGCCFRPNLKTEYIKDPIERSNLKDRTQYELDESQYLNTILHDVRDVCFRSKNVKLKDLNKVEIYDRN